MTIVQEIKQLCDLGKYDEAIALTNKIEIKEFAIRAHLLCIEHEHCASLDKAKALRTK